MAESGAGWLLVGRQEGTRDDADDGLAGNLVLCSWKQYRKLCSAKLFIISLVIYTVQCE